MFPTHASDQKRKFLSTAATVCMDNLMMMGMKASHVWFCMLLILMCSVSYSSGQGCIYNVQVRTGDRDWAGLDCGTVRLDLCSTPNSCFVTVPNLTRFGIEGPSHRYFQRGNNDVFRFQTVQACQRACRIIVILYPASCPPAWYLDSVNVQAFDGGVPKSMDHFNVFQWLSFSSTRSVAVNHCPISAAPAQLASVLPLQSGVA